MGTTGTSEALFSGGVLEERDGDVVLSDEFEASVSDHRATVADRSREELADLLRESVGEEAVEPLLRLREKDPAAVAELLALREQVTAPETDPLALLPALRLFRPESVRAEGAPEPFVPIPGDQLPEFVDLYSRLFVYVWLDDCDPCDAVKSRLESVFARPRDVLPLAVYGPEYRDALASEYDVTAGPAMLFFRDGAVDTRLYGAHTEEIIETELEKLRA